MVLNFSAIFTLILTLVAAILLISELLRPDLIALIVMVILGLVGTVSPTETPSPRSMETPVTSVGAPLSDKTTLAYPNPFRGDGNVTIQFTLDDSAAVDVKIFDLMGRPVWSGGLPAGSGQIGLNKLMWDGRNASKVPVATGAYVCRITSGRHAVTKKIFVVH